jgi:hypothetical protein
MFCSFFDLSGNPSRISPAKSMPPAAERRPLVLPDLRIGREYFLDLFMKQALKPHIASRSTRPDVIRIMVSNGDDYTLANVRPRCEIALDGRRLIPVGRPQATQASGGGNPQRSCGDVSGGRVGVTAGGQAWTS